MPQRQAPCRSGGPKRVTAGAERRPVARHRARSGGSSRPDAAGLLAARAAAVPKSKDLRETWWKVGDQGDAPARASAGRPPTRCCAGTSSRPAGSRTPSALSKRFIWMASKETDEFTSSPTHVHRERRHEPEGGARRGAQVRGGEGERAAVQRRRCIPARPRRSTRSPRSSRSAPTSTCRSTAAARSSRGGAGSRPSGPILDAARRRPHAGTTPSTPPATSTSTSRRRSAAATPSRSSATRADRFIVRNSWGTDWGDTGLRLRVARLRAGRVHGGVRDLGAQQRGVVTGPARSRSRS